MHCRQHSKGWLPILSDVNPIHSLYPKDIYSYDEDDMVLDPHLDKHLLHFGIDVSKMKKVPLLLFFRGRIL